MNLNHLAIFQAAAEEGGISRGAARLHISQPAVSKQVRALERSLGVTLFDRVPKGVRLTEAGELLAGYARRLFAVESAAEHALGELRGLERGRLAVGASTTIGVYLLPEVLAAFHRRYPAVDVRLEIGNTDAIQEMLLANQLDVGLTEGFVEMEGLEARVFREDDLVAIAPPGHPLLARAGVTAAELCAEPLIVREAGSGTRAVVERAFAALGLVVRPAMSLGSTEAIKRAVMAGAGVAVVSRLALAVEIESGRLEVVPVDSLPIPRSLHLLRAAHRHQGAATRAFLELLADFKT
jgi:DNA-binding transcriptional LysR family regulator